MSARRGAALAAAAVGIVLAGCGGGGDNAAGDIKTIAPTKMTTVGVSTPADFKPVDLKGLDKPTKLDGKCFSEFVVLNGGLDAAKVQHYLLSFEVKGDPKNTFELFDFLEKNDCGDQQRDAHDKAAKTLGLKNDGTAPSPFETSYRTTSGARLFL